MTWNSWKVNYGRTACDCEGDNAARPPDRDWPADGASYPGADFRPEEREQKGFGSMESWQKACVGSLAASVQMRQEAYLSRHPEVKAMLEIFTCKIAKMRPRDDQILELAIRHFTRPYEEMDKEIREYLKLPFFGPYFKGKGYAYSDEQLMEFLSRTKTEAMPQFEDEEVPPPPCAESSHSSQFSTFNTSDTTIPTPEPVPTPEPTIEEIFYIMVSDTVDRAIYLKVDDWSLMYDTAYVELTKAAEEAMEIPVVELKEDIIMMLHAAYKCFELEIIEKERLAYENYLATRMRRHVKKSLRAIFNFKGYAPSIPLGPDDDEDFPPKPPILPPGMDVEAEFEEVMGNQIPVTYNRYSKDHFGVPKPVNEDNFIGNTTTTPRCSPAPSSVGVRKDTKKNSNEKKDPLTSSPE